MAKALRPRAAFSPPAHSPSAIFFPARVTFGGRTPVSARLLPETRRSSCCPSDAEVNRASGYPRPGARVRREGTSRHRMSCGLPKLFLYTALSSAAATEDETAGGPKPILSQFATYLQ